MSKQNNNFFTISPFKDQDAKALINWISGSEFDLFLLSSRLTHPIKLKSFNTYFNSIDQKSHKLFSVYLRETNEHVGHFEIKNINKKYGTGTGAHILLAPNHRKKGYGKHFINIVSKVGFIDLNLYRMSLSVHTINTKAVSAYIKAGYQFEGIIRDILMFKGKRYSLYQMSLLKTEWEMLQK